MATTAKHRQLSLAEALRAASSRFHPALAVPVVDLFCSVGGFSEGARQAGHVTRVAVDSDSERCFVHHQNHKDCVYVVTQLPCPLAEVHFPPPDTLWHLHGSPPCQKLSVANGGNVRQNDDQVDRTAVGLNLVTYFLDLVEEKRPCTWTFEQVNHPNVIALLEARRLSYVVCHMEEWGLPQSRVRVIAGTPHIIRRFQGLRNPAKSVAVADVLLLPVPGARVKGSTANYSAATKPGRVNRVVPKIRRCRCASKPSLTVIGVGHNLVWCDANGDTLRQLSVEENAVLQGFPPNYIFNEMRTLAQVEVGDAFPPLIAKLLMENYRLPFDVWPALPPPAVFWSQPTFSRSHSPSLDF